MTIEKSSANIEFDGIFDSIRVDTVKQLYQDLAHMASNLSGISKEDILNVFMQDEKKAFYATGQGLAFPNFTSEAVKEPFIMFMRLAAPLEADTPDGNPIECLVLVISPDIQAGSHLRLLSRVTRMFRDEKMVSQLKSAEDIDAIQAVLEYKQFAKNAA